MSEVTDAVAQLVEDEDKRQREHEILNKAPLDVITGETVDAALAAAEAAGDWERHSALNAIKAADLRSRTDANGVIHARPEDTGVVDHSADVGTPEPPTRDQLRELLKEIDAELTSHSQNVRAGSIERMKVLREQRAEIERTLHGRRS